MEGEQRRPGQREEGRMREETEDADSPRVAQTLFGGLDCFSAVASRSSCLAGVGCALAWLALVGPKTVEACYREEVLEVLRGREFHKFAMRRGRSRGLRSLFPIPLGDIEGLHERALRTGLDEFVVDTQRRAEPLDAWLVVSICAVNGIAGYGRLPILGAWTAGHRQAATALRASIKRMLDKDCCLDRSVEQAEKELSSRFLSYTGEEVPKMQVVSLTEIEPALPPISHGGSIHAVELVSPITRDFLENPENSVREQFPLLGKKLQAKVHVTPGEELEVAKLLISRNICSWVDVDDVFTVDSQPVLNGMFAVGKGVVNSLGKEIQRLIMNLIPTNSVMEQARGAVGDLPSITQYLSLVLEQDEKLLLYQSDMSSAFYLFKIPECWHRFMAFNLKLSRASLGLGGSGYVYLCCAVIPMGWASAVSIMQEIADRLTVIGSLPLTHKIRRTSPLPSWLLDVTAAAKREGCAWFHVYLDNFCAMEKRDVNEGPGLAKGFHEALEQAWEQCGVLSSAKKRVSGVEDAQELGGEMKGGVGTLGPSSERLVRLVQSTLVVVSKKFLRKKWVQVVAGRWVHVMSFRRPGMIQLDTTWDFVSHEWRRKSVETQVRSELLGCCFLALLLHTDLRAAVSPIMTASDASSTGGAVGMSDQLTQSGREFAYVDRSLGGLVCRAPILVLSLFNGIGCAFRCYDLVGIVPMFGISYEISKAANRVSSRRWPNVVQEGDVRGITREVVRKWKFLYPQIEQIDIWAGFPCVDLSAVKFNRKNLAGEQSGLFWEVLRIIKLVRSEFGFHFKVNYFAENVASMDREACSEISLNLGGKPYRVDSADCVPIHRPRFCWSNVAFSEVEGVTVEDKEFWYEVRMVHEYPEVSQWLEEGAVWPGEVERVVFPTCMKSIVRSCPPPKPAGLSKCDRDTCWRWEADRFRFPPYQYKSGYLIWVNDKWRLLSASERELLHGLGFDHTALCWAAGKIKDDPVGFEDVRKSLIGDSFNCFSFAYFAALSCRKWLPQTSLNLWWNRAGMAPGMCTPGFVDVPLIRRLSYGPAAEDDSPAQIHRGLLKRVNHTGSDVRISSGAILNPKNFPRQSAPAAWFVWKPLFAYKWSRADHINSLELRAIIHAVEWRISHLKELNSRIFHLSDSYISISVISKGRSSSRMLKPLLRRLAALLLTFNVYLVVAHVESTENPTDHASRL